MPNQSHEPENVTETLRKLQRESAWMKRIGIAFAAVLILVLFLSRGNFQTVTAREFKLTDSDGRTRATLGISPDGSTLTLYAPSGEERAELVGGPEDASLDLYIPPSSSSSSRAGIRLYAGNKLAASFRAGPSAAVLRLNSADGRGSAAVSVKPGVATLGMRGAGDQGSSLLLRTGVNRSCVTATGARMRKTSGNASMCADSQGLPTFTLAGLQGSKAILGVTQTTDRRTGKPVETSAASLVLEGPDGKVLWSTPR